MKRGLLTVAGIAVLATIASGTVVLRLTLREIETHASEIFEGTVLAIDTYEDEGPRKLIYTEVTFYDLTAYKGTFKGRTATYRFAGGTWGERTLRVVGMPEFTVGQRCFLFTNEAKDRTCPTVGWWQGRYLIREDRKRRARLHDSSGRAVYAIRDGYPVLKPKKKTDRPMLAADFTAIVKSEIALGEIRRRKQHEAAERGKE